MKEITHERVVLDTSAYSHFRGNHAAVIDAIAAAEIVLVPVVVIGELEAAFRMGSREKENCVVLQEFLAEPFVRMLPIGADVALRYGALVSALRKAGTPIPANDVWIAAVTFDVGAHLITFDSDFARVPGLSCTILRASARRRS